MNSINSGQLRGFLFHPERYVKQREGESYWQVNWDKDDPCLVTLLGSPIHGEQRHYFKGWSVV